MEYRRLGTTGLEVSRICLGTNNFGGQLDDKTSAAIITKAMDLGVNVIDTANMYTRGNSERAIGRALKGRREEVVIATKVGMRIGEGPNHDGLSRKHIMWQVRHSLEHLQTDYIDIYYMHRWDDIVPLEETLTTFNDLVHEGLVRYVAVSNWNAAQIDKARKICKAHDLESIIAVQPPYNIIQREAEDNLLPYCKKEKLGVLTYTPLMGGFLTGKYERGKPPPPGSRAIHAKGYMDRLMTEENYAKLEKLNKVATDASVPLHKLAIAWIIRNPTVTATILGASSVEQVADNCSIFDLKLPDKVFKELEKATATT